MRPSYHESSSASHVQYDQIGELADRLWYGTCELIVPQISTKRMVIRVLSFIRSASNRTYKSPRLLSWPMTSGMGPVNWFIAKFLQRNGKGQKDEIYLTLHIIVHTRIEDQSV